MGLYTDPCSKGVYRVLNEAWRNVNHGKDSPVRCDDGFNGEWYRFMGPAGSVMPTQRPATPHICGAESPMWMNGTHPTPADGVVFRQVCNYWYGSPCEREVTIHVKACPAGFYVYKLPAAPFCWLVYCGETVCGRCLGGEVNCNPVSDVCSAGCQDGWKTHVQLCKENGLIKA
ncbi:oncoprotein-induced transcript 3 protein-like [Branchiostoma lanceolatum]|uniref:oncoprotein-induced transcript 3 protein-like n=1 Tax=Branchiostoma lanceolatum TaxID=7740 RepID=UPI003456B48F